MIVEFVGGPFCGGHLEGIRAGGVLLFGRLEWAGFDTVGGWWAYKRRGKGADRFDWTGYAKTRAGLSGECRGWPEYELQQIEWARDTSGKWKYVVVERRLDRG